LFHVEIVSAFVGDIATNHLAHHSALQEIAAGQGIEQAVAQVLDPGLVSTVFDRSRRQHLARHQPPPVANLARF